MEINNANNTGELKLFYIKYLSEYNAKGTLNSMTFHPDAGHEQSRAFTINIPTDTLLFVNASVFPRRLMNSRTNAKVSTAKVNIMFTEQYTGGVVGTVNRSSAVVTRKVVFLKAGAYTVDVHIALSPMMGVSRFEENVQLVLAGISTEDAFRVTLDDSADKPCLELMNTIGFWTNHISLLYGDVIGEYAPATGIEIVDAGSVELDEQLLSYSNNTVTIRATLLKGIVPPCAEKQVYRVIKLR